MLHFIINKKKVCLDQFLAAAKAFPMNYEKYFVQHDDELTPEKVKSILSLPATLMKYLDECSLKGTLNICLMT